MGASRILSAKKHSAKLSKYSTLLYASSAHISFPPPSFRDSVYCHKAGFLSMLEPLGCGWLFFIGCSIVCIDCLCVKGDEVYYFLWNEETNYCDKFSCFMLLFFSMIDPLGVDSCSLLDVERYFLFDSLCIIEDESLRLFLITERKTNPVLKISCLTSLALRQ